MPSNMNNYNAGYEAFMDDEEFDHTQDQDWQDGYLDAQAIGA
jgi:hypothetical protein